MKRNIKTFNKLEKEMVKRRYSYGYHRKGSFLGGYRTMKVDGGTLYDGNKILVLDSQESIDTTNISRDVREDVEILVIPKGVAEIPASSFYFWNRLRLVVIPETVKHIGNNAFTCCNKMESISLPEGLETIGKRAFAGCWGLREIHIPSNVKSIGDEAFAGCKVCRIVFKPKTFDIDIGHNAFESMANQFIIIQK